MYLLNNFGVFILLLLYKTLLFSTSSSGFSWLICFIFQGTWHFLSIPFSYAVAYSISTKNIQNEQSKQINTKNCNKSAKQCTQKTAAERQGSSVPSIFIVEHKISNSNRWQVEISIVSSFMSPMLDVLFSLPNLVET